MTQDSIRYGLSPYREAKVDKVLLVHGLILIACISSLAVLDAIGV